MGKHAVVICADGYGCVEVLDAVWSELPPDAYTDRLVALMEYEGLLCKHAPEHHAVEYTERFAFYARAKKVHLIIATGETAIYANGLLKRVL